VGSAKSPYDRSPSGLRSLPRRLIDRAGYDLQRVCSPPSSSSAFKAPRRHVRCGAPGFPPTRGTAALTALLLGDAAQPRPAFLRNRRPPRVSLHARKERRHAPPALATVLRRSVVASPCAYSRHVFPRARALSPRGTTCACCPRCRSRGACRDWAGSIRMGRVLRPRGACRRYQPGRGSTCRRGTVSGRGRERSQVHGRLGVGGAARTHLLD